MRWLFPLLALLVCACTNPTPAVALLAAEGASVAVFGRGIVDLGVSAVTGRDCSIVRLDRGTTYCAPIDRPLTDPYCTHSLGRVDCWADRRRQETGPPGVADTPAPSPAQDRYRTARWPKTLALD